MQPQESLSSQGRQSVELPVLVFFSAKSKVNHIKIATSKTGHTFTSEISTFSWTISSLSLGVPTPFPISSSHPDAIPNNFKFVDVELPVDVELKKCKKNYNVRASGAALLSRMDALVPDTGGACVHKKKATTH